jgi:hydrogenase nickel incorporation protein HypB
MEIKIYEKVMSANDAIASEIRKLLSANNIIALNVIGSPGSGKTTVLEAVIPMLLKKKPPVESAVIEGDLATAYDAERLGSLGITAVQVNTGSGCHLDANLIYKPLKELLLEKINIIFIENVGNLVCPSQFDLGENAKIAVLSVSEGDDKAAKYPLLFRVASCVVLNKIDLLPYSNFNKERFWGQVRKINPNITCFEISAANGEGVEEFINWICKYKMCNEK